jgi:hypothetical protein
MLKQNSLRRSERKKRDTLQDRLAEPPANVGIRVEYFEGKGRGWLQIRTLRRETM